MLTLTLFLCSIGILSNYIREMREASPQYTPISSAIANFIININYMAVLIPWIVLILLIIFPTPKCYPLLYKYAIKTPLVISIFIFTFTLFGRWFVKGINNLLGKYISMMLLKGADEDIKKLENKEDDDLSNNLKNY